MKNILNYRLFYESLSEKEKRDYHNLFIEDMNDLFFYFVKKYNLSTESAKEMFKPRTDFFVDFITNLESYPWFDYGKLNYFLEEWNILLDSIDEMREDGIFDEEDEYEDDETEEY